MQSITGKKAGDDAPVAIAWAGDLSADCSARWKGLKLLARFPAGAAATDSWWWAVYDMRTFEEVRIESSDEHNDDWADGPSARGAAEAAARRYFQAGRKKQPATGAFDRLVFTVSGIGVAAVSLLSYPSFYTAAMRPGTDPPATIGAGIFYGFTFVALSLRRLMGREMNWPELSLLLLLNCLLYGLLIERVIFLVKTLQQMKSRRAE